MSIGRTVAGDPLPMMRMPWGVKVFRWLAAGVPTCAGVGVGTAPGNAFDVVGLGCWTDCDVTDAGTLSAVPG